MRLSRRGLTAIRAPRTGRPSREPTPSRPPWPPATPAPATPRPPTGASSPTSTTAWSSRPDPRSSNSTARSPSGWPRARRRVWKSPTHWAACGPCRATTCCPGCAAVCWSGLGGTPRRGPSSSAPPSSPPTRGSARFCWRVPPRATRVRLNRRAESGTRSARPERLGPLGPVSDPRRLIAAHKRIGDTGPAGQGRVIPAGEPGPGFVGGLVELQRTAHWIVVLTRFVVRVVRGVASPCRHPACRARTQSLRLDALRLGIRIGVERGLRCIGVAVPEPRADLLPGVGLAGGLVHALRRRDVALRIALGGDVAGEPVDLNRADLPGEGRAELLQDPAYLAVDAERAMRVLGDVGLVLGVLRERPVLVRQVIGMGMRESRIDVERTQCVLGLRIERRDGLVGERNQCLAAVVGVDPQHVIEEVEPAREQRPLPRCAELDRGPAARPVPQGDVPPVIAADSAGQSQLANDLQIAVQGFPGGLPLLVRDGRQDFRGGPCRFAHARELKRGTGEAPANALPICTARSPNAPPRPERPHPAAATPRTGPAPRPRPRAAAAPRPAPDPPRADRGRRRPLSARPRGRRTAPPPARPRRRPWPAGPGSRPSARCPDGRCRRRIPGARASRRLPGARAWRARPGPRPRS